jgi:hypothetical protein
MTPSWVPAIGEALSEQSTVSHSPSTCEAAAKKFIAIDSLFLSSSKAIPSGSGGFLPNHQEKATML